MGDTRPPNHVVLCLAILMAPVSAAVGQIEFTEVGATRGIGAVGFTAPGCGP